MKKVLVFGTFDIVHEGHLYFFREAKKYGDHLSVVVARDATVLAVKGKKPHYLEDTRLSHVAGVDIVDHAVLGVLGKNKYVHLIDLQPDVIALGYDQMAFTEKLEEFIRENGLATVIVRLDAYMPEKYKSSLIKNEL